MRHSFGLFAGALLVAVGTTAAYAADVIQLAPPEGASGDQFGQALAADGGTVVVGAPQHDHDATDAGAAYVFVRRGIFLPLQTELRPSDPEASAHFGAAVAVSLDTVAVGAPDDGGTGAVYVFERTRGAWSQTAKLAGASSGDRFGAAVAIDGDTLVAGAPGRSSATGAVYVYLRSGTTWSQQAAIDGTSASGAFGTSVALRGDRFVAGAPLASSSRGLAKVHTRNGTSWSLEATLDPTDAADGDETGGAVAIDGEWIALGAAKADATGAADAGAVHVYGLSGGTWTRSARLSAPTPAAGAAFGSAVALDADTLAIGSPLSDVGATDAGGTELFVPGAGGWAFCTGVTVPGSVASDEHGAAVALAAGRVVSAAPGRGGGTAFVRCADADLRLTASDGQANDLFGGAVALSEDTAVVGRAWYSGKRGSAYVFVRSGGLWRQQAELTAADGEANDSFGSAVAIWGDTVLVGADSADLGGAAYVFVRSGGTWTQQQKLTPPDPWDSDGFGTAVSLWGDTALIGVPFDDDESGTSGSAYVFVRTAGVWSAQQKLNASDVTQGWNFGCSVALEKDTALVGRVSGKGSAYVFVRSGNLWSQQQKLTASDGQDGDGFGFSVALSGDIALIGATDDDDYGLNSGSAYVFLRSGNVWEQRQKLHEAEGTVYGRFGSSVALTADTALVASATLCVFERTGETWALQPSPPGAPSGTPVALCEDTALVGQQYFGPNDTGAAQIRRLAVTALDPDAKLTGSGNDQFGWAVALSRETALVGAYGDGVLGSGAGAAYVSVRPWAQQQKLTASDGASSDLAGTSVAFFGDTALIGAPGYGTGTGTGRAYVFAPADGRWAEQQELTPSDGAAGDEFGFAVAISGDTALVGAVGDDDLGPSSGSVQVFARSGGSWEFVQKLVAADGAAGDRFGTAVAVSGDVALVGAEDDDDRGTWSGSCYVFVRSGGAWTQQAKLTASDGTAYDEFGHSVAISGNTAVVGAYWDSDSGVGSGSAYVFVQSGGTWSQQQKLTARDGYASDTFGLSVALSEDTALVGAKGHDANGADTGAAYLFTRSEGTWTSRQTLTAPDSVAYGEFGISVALSETTALVGASGSAYVFEERHVRPAVPAIALPAEWTVGMPLAGTCSVADGTAPYQWRVVSGALPAGVSLAAGTGAISGTPTSTGNFGFTLECSDAWGSKSSASRTVDVHVAPSVPPSSLEWTVARPCTLVLPRSGGTAPFAWTLSSGTAPPGTAIASNGVLAGTPSVAGNTTFVVRVTDAAGATATGTISMTVHASPLITTSGLGPWTERRPFRQVLQRSGGTYPVTWSVIAGSLPVDAPLDAATGLLDGAARSAGTYAFTAKLADATGATDSRVFTVSVNPWPELTSATLPLGVQGRPYDTGPRVTGGTAPITWTIRAGDLPSGLGLESGTGHLTGSPSGTDATVLDFQVTDAAGAVATRSIPFVCVPRCDLAKAKLTETHAIAAGAGDIVRYVELLGGTDVDITMSVKTKTDATVAMLLLDAAEQPIDLAPYTKAKKSAVTVKDFPVPATGRYFLVLRPDAAFEGSVKLTVAAAATKSWKSGGTLESGDVPLTFDFPALPGSKLVVTTKAAKKSAALPTIGGLADGDGNELLDPGELKETKTGATLKALTPLAGGDYRLTIVLRGGAAGAVEWTVQLKSPKGYAFELPELAVGGP
jgi:FG-GAP repeat protein/putative Ig domain-containing protein